MIRVLINLHCRAQGKYTTLRLHFFHFGLETGQFLPVFILLLEQLTKKYQGAINILLPTAAPRAPSSGDVGPVFQVTEVLVDFLL